MTLDPDRELCPDGACIGVIGPDGRCKECGRISPRVTRDPRLAAMERPEVDAESADVDDDDRRLCPDGSCTGLIGPDGRCSECGREADPEEPGAAEDASADDGEAPAAAAESTSGADSDDDDRELCPDGGCIGLIGPDGRCGECGKPREGLPG